MITKEKKLVFDPKKYKFKCLQCGNCCTTFPASAKIGSIQHFNHKGQFVKNPKTGICIFNFEIDKIKQKLTQEQLSKINPGYTIFLKDYPIGFIDQYQIRYNKYGHCSFFDFRTRKCNIYSFRPLVCRIFPLSYLGNNKYILGDGDLNACKAFLSEVSHQNSIDIEDIDTTQFYHLDMSNSFPSITQEQLKITQSHQVSNNIFEYFSEMILDIEQLSINIIKNHKLLDLKDFVNWFKSNIKDKILLKRLNDYQKQLKIIVELSNIYHRATKLRKIGLSEKVIILKIDEIIKKKSEGK